MSKWDRPGMAELVDGIWQNQGEVALRQQVATWIGPRKGKFLDLGCGTATMAPFYPTQYYGVDGSEEMLRIARTRAKKRPLKLCDFSTESIPYPDGFFDWALCMQVIRHMVSYEHVLKELARTVKESVFIHDLFHDGPAHIYDKAEVGGVTFENNSWSLDLFIADAKRIFPGAIVKKQPFNYGYLGLEISR